MWPFCYGPSRAREGNSACQKVLFDRPARSNFMFGPTLRPVSTGIIAIVLAVTLGNPAAAAPSSAEDERTLVGPSVLAYAFAEQGLDGFTQVSHNVARSHFVAIDPLVPYTDVVVLIDYYLSAQVHDRCTGASSTDRGCAAVIQFHADWTDEDDGVAEIMPFQLYCEKPICADDWDGTYQLERRFEHPLGLLPHEQSYTICLLATTYWDWDWDHYYSDNPTSQAGSCVTGVIHFGYVDL